jgi:hypothetical protein
VRPPRRSSPPDIGPVVFFTIQACRITLVSSARTTGRNRATDVSAARRLAVSSWPTSWGHGRSSNEMTTIVNEAIAWESSKSVATVDKKQE